MLCASLWWTGQWFSKGGPRNEGLLELELFRNANSQAPPAKSNLRGWGPGKVSEWVSQDSDVLSLRTAKLVSTCSRFLVIYNLFLKPMYPCVSHPLCPRSHVRSLLFNHLHFTHCSSHSAPMDEGCFSGTAGIKLNGTSWRHRSRLPRPLTCSNCSGYCGSWSWASFSRNHFSCPVHVAFYPLVLASLTDVFRACLAKRICWAVSYFNWSVVHGLSEC